MAETFYLTKDVSKEIRDLSSLTDWEQEVARILLSPGSEGKTEKIRSILPSIDTVDRPLIQSLLEMLPKNIQSRSKIFLHYFLAKVRIADGGIVELPDGSQTAPLVDIVRYFCSPSHLKVRPPLGLETLLNFLASIGMPQSAYGNRREEETMSNKNYEEKPKRWISL